MKQRSSARARAEAAARAAPLDRFRRTPPALCAPARELLARARGGAAARAAAARRRCGRARARARALLALAYSRALLALFRARARRARARRSRWPVLAGYQSATLALGAARLMSGVDAPVYKRLFEAMAVWHAQQALARARAPPPRAPRARRAAAPALGRAAAARGAGGATAAAAAAAARVLYANQYAAVAAESLFLLLRKQFTARASGPARLPRPAAPVVGVVHRAPRARRRASAAAAALVVAPRAVVGALHAAHHLATLAGLSSDAGRSRTPGRLLALGARSARSAPDTRSSRCCSARARARLAPALALAQLGFCGHVLLLNAECELRADDGAGPSRPPLRAAARPLVRLEQPLAVRVVARARIPRTSLSDIGVPREARTASRARSSDARARARALDRYGSTSARRLRRTARTCCSNAVGAVGDEAEPLSPSGARAARGARGASASRARRAARSSRPRSRASVRVAALAEFVLGCRDVACRAAPSRMLPCVERALDALLPADAHEQLQRPAARAAHARRRVQPAALLRGRGRVGL